MDIKNLTGSNLRPDGAPSGAGSRGAKAGEPPLVGREGASPSSSSPAGGVDDSVTLTGIGRTMSATLDSEPTVPFDQQKVSEIKLALSEGRYPIDNQRLADRIISLERLLA